MNTLMRKIWPLALLVPVLLAAGIGVAEVPNLVGNWTGSGEQDFQGHEYQEGLSINMTVVEQKGRLFTSLPKEAPSFRVGRIWAVSFRR